MSLTARSESQEAHTHGLATLTLALENSVLEIQFESPAANLVGFEHKATSSEEKKAVTQTETSLKEPNLLFSFVGASCQPKKTTVDISGVMDNHNKKYQEHDEHEDHSHAKKHDEHDEHERHSHAKEHDKHDEHEHHSHAKERNKHDEHEHHSHSKEHDADSHSEISASYRFSCDDTAKLSSVSVSFFKQFPGIEKIDAMWITDIKQGAITLTPNKHTISLR